MEIGPPELVGKGAGREPGVMAFVMGAAVGRGRGGIEGRLVKAFVPAYRPCGGVGGLEAREGTTEVPMTD